MTTSRQQRISITSENGKIVRVVLQQQRDEPVMFHGAVNWEDVRELPISEDGKTITLSKETTAKGAGEL